MNEKILRDLYWNQNLSSRQIAKQYNTNHVSILRRMRIYGIPRREAPKAYFKQPKTKVSKLSKEEIAYIAGIFDGEGSLSISKCGEVIFRIGNTDKKLMDWLSKRLNYPYSVVKLGENSFCKKDFYAITISRTSDLCILLKYLFPYLVTKKGKAKEIIKICSNRLRNSNIVIGWKAEV